MPGEVRPIVEVRDLGRADLPNAVGGLARGMRDNPLHVAAFGDDPERRRRALERVFTTLVRVMTAQSPIGAFDDVLVGLTGIAPAGTCRSTAVQTARRSAVDDLGWPTAPDVTDWYRSNYGFDPFVLPLPDDPGVLPHRPHE